MNTPNTIEIIIADDHPIFIEGLRVALRKHKNIKIIAEAQNGIELLEKVQKFRPQVVLTDIFMPHMDGLEATKEIMKLYMGVEVIAMTMNSEESMILDMMEAGAKGYFMKNASSRELVEAIEKVSKKQIYYCTDSANKIVRVLARSKIHPYKTSQKITFTDYELQIIRLICQEFCSKEIAVELSSRETAINAAKDRIRNKMGVKTAIGMVIFAINHGIFSID